LGLGLSWSPEGSDNRLRRLDDRSIPDERLGRGELRRDNAIWSDSGDLLAQRNAHGLGR
jgi:hypothetical protein